MGKYIGSPWGFIRGKVGDTVGGVWKGIDWCRVRVLPTQRGTLDLYRQYKDGLIPPSRFSYPQMNLRRAVLQVLGYIARMNMTNWINLPWQALVDKRGWTLTATNAFVKRNAATLLATMDRTTEFDEATNAPDLTQMLVSDGDLEATPLLSAIYSNLTGDLVVTWAKNTFTNGALTDRALLMVAKKPILESIGRDGTWYPQLFMYGVDMGIGLGTTRDDETMTFTLPIGLDAANLTAYLFFRDVPLSIGYSKSEALQVTLIA